jgi:hypothetical protein
MEKLKEPHFERDANGTPVRAVWEYEDYLKIAEQLNLPLASEEPVKEQNPLDWYELTESAHSVLHSIVTLAAREEMNEQRKTSPDEQRIAELKALGNEAMKMVEDTNNFSSIDRMRELVDKYSPILLEEKKKIRS